MQQVDYNNPSLYKPCRLKRYDCYVCKPSKNTLVYNKSEHPELSSLFGSSSILLANALKQAVSQGFCYAVTEQTPYILVLPNVTFSTVNLNYLINNFTFMRDGMDYPINNQSLSSYMSGDCLDWF